MAKQLLLLLGDQLYIPADMNKQDTVILCAEAKEFYSDIPHHKKKLILLFSALRHFAEQLQSQGWHVDYHQLSNEKIKTAIEAFLLKHTIKRIVVPEPGSYKVKQELLSWAPLFQISIHIMENKDFLLSHQGFETWAEDRKLFRMEDFYRFTRQRTGYLMDGPKPISGRWNFDKDNRKPAKSDTRFPSSKAFSADPVTQQVIDDVEHHFPTHFGLAKNFDFAVTAEDASTALDHFITFQLPHFGATQDAMLMGQPVMNHSLLSAYLNIGLLRPKQVCDAAQSAYEKGVAPIEAVEGFIRQIIGWREYIRGFYWHFMPDYAHLNFFNTQRNLPDFYWTTDTKMTCMKEALTQTRDLAYAHHIQRLMITGNFAMLYGVEPSQIHKWYLAVYGDAHEWVELPNVLGMSQFADGGLLASKPYAASGNYINRMSDYCKNCTYDVRAKTEENACPFNSLYWDFLARNKALLKDNMRLKTSYMNWHRLDNSNKLDILKRANILKEQHNL